MRCLRVDMSENVKKILRLLIVVFAMRFFFFFDIFYVNNHSMLDFDEIITFFLLIIQ